MSSENSQPDNENCKKGNEAMMASDNNETTISKSQMKKLLRKQRWFEARPERKRLEKEKRRAKRKADAELRKESEQTGVQYRSSRPKLMADSSNKFKIVIDMDFEDYMTESELGKAVKQVGRIYASNRHSDQPCQLYISSLKGKIRDQFNVTNSGYQNWDVNLSELNYIDTFKSENDLDEVKKRFVYLSGDSENTLPDVDELVKDESTIFVIGGLVDHNRHKNLCHRRAIECNIRTAKIPIKEHISLCQRHILSTVTVFEILLHVLGARKQWPEALKLCIPKRKVVQEADK